MVYLRACLIIVYEKPNCHALAILLLSVEEEEYSNHPQLPYSGFISREKIFTNFADLSQFVKILFANSIGSGSHAVHAIGGVANIMAIRENFIREIHKCQPFAKIFSREINPLYGMCVT